MSNRVHPQGDMFGEHDIMSTDMIPAVQIKVRKG